MRVLLAPKDQREPEIGGGETESPPEAPAGKTKGKRAAAKSPRGNAERALAHLRAARKAQREVTDPVERARLQLAEANVLALLELAEAMGGNSGNDAAPSE